jgi:3alpha(or 20beta)-hydroxysteroid dehydrogenase
VERNSTGRLAGRVAIVSGGARGQGAAHAECLARDGAVVLAGDVRHELGEEMAAGLREQGLDVTYQPLDVTSTDDWAAAMKWADGKGRLDVLVNNAGIVHVNPLEEESLEKWNRIIAVNQTGPLLGMQAAVPLMRRTGGGSIINTASVYGLNGAEDYIAYCATKGALIAMTKTAALELGKHGIRVNALAPGAIETPILVDEPVGRMVPLTALKRRAAASEMATIVAFLASDDASYMTGSVVIADAGYTAL